MKVHEIRVLAVCCAVILGAGMSPSLSAQEGESPADWSIRLDRQGDVNEIAFVTMTPGWHITSGPAAIYFDPSRRAVGEFSVESTTFMFDPNGRNEAFGVFVGGADLEGPEQRYVYFLVRPSGEFLIKQRRGSETPVLVDWTAHEAVVGWQDKAPAAATAENVLSIHAEPEVVRFEVNGTEVASLSRTGLDLEGIVGLRANHAVNVHVSSLDVTSGN